MYVCAGIIHSLYLNSYYQLLLYPLSVFLQGDDDRVSFPTDDHKVCYIAICCVYFNNNSHLGWPLQVRPLSVTPGQCPGGLWA